MLAANFGGRAISTQNLSEWKQGGYEDWVRHQENCAYACILTEMSRDLEEEAGEIRLEERLMAPATMALARLLREAEEAPGGPDMQKTVLDVARQLSQLRRVSQQAERVRLERERWEQKQAEAKEKQRKAAERVARAAAIWEQTKAEFPALGEMGVGNAEWKPPRKRRVCTKTRARRARPDPQERERIKAGRGKSKSSRIHAVGDEGRPEPEGRAMSRGGKAVIRVRQRRNNTRDARFAGCLTLPEGQERELTGAAPGESNQIKPNQTSCEDVNEVQGSPHFTW
jgi:hypothetical protein